MKTLLLSAALVLSAAVGASAATVWDEAVDGDLSGFIGISSDDVGTLTAPVSSIFGGYDSNVSPTTNLQPDRQDSVLFTAVAPGSVTGTVLSGDEGQLVFYDMTTNVPAFLQLTDLSDTIFFSAPGRYGIVVLGTRNAGAGSYRLDVTQALPPVPLPASGVLLLGGIAGMIALRRKTRSTTSG
ncbi:MAG: VPLPA-CTERM sorting domain-containing protein [Pseudomonadota bacterium]